MDCEEEGPAQVTEVQIMGRLGNWEVRVGKMCCVVLLCIGVDCVATAKNHVCTVLVIVNTPAWMDVKRHQ